MCAICRSPTPACLAARARVADATADIAARLSDKEAQFARDYFVLFGSHMKAAAANHLPGASARQGRGSLLCFAPAAERLQRSGLPACSLQLCRQGPCLFPSTHPCLTRWPAAEAFSSLVRQAAAHPHKDMVPAPDPDKHVFCRVLEDRGSVTVDEEGCAGAAGAAAAAEGCRAADSSP